jgi:multidrug efflux pump subunit AcrB
VAWTYTSLNPEQLEGRLTTPGENSLTTLADNIEHIDSPTYNGTAVVKVFLQPGAKPGHCECAGDRSLLEN